MKKIMLLSLLFMSIGATAASYAPQQSTSPWHVSAGGGYTFYPDMLGSDGESVFGRFAISRDIKEMNGMMWGLELGIQTAAQMRLELTPTQNSDLGDTSVISFIKPMADLLVSVSKSVNDDNQVSAFIKGGIAYRHMVFDRDTITPLRKINPELQVGLAKRISNNAIIALAYQGIYTGKVDLTTSNPTNIEGAGTGNVKNIPSQNGVLLTVNFDFE